VATERRRPLFMGRGGGFTSRKKGGRKRKGEKSLGENVAFKRGGTGPIEGAYDK